MAVNAPVQIFAGLLAAASGNMGSAVATSTLRVLKEIHLYNSGAGANVVKIRRVGTDTDVGNIVHETMAAGATLNLPFSQAWIAGEQMKGFATTASEVHCIASGITVT